ncbi:ROK family protein [Actinomyces respiraculi]|uniref:ROK family protein n=1 Tax=Actinomyces respiraculi TaxID=2744574 RepID=UPI00142072F4|nr:ROK family protein [Actinomyces respiraculi]
MQSPPHRDDVATPHNVAALDIGGTKINAALVRISGTDAEIIESATTPTVTSDGSDGVLAAAIQVTKEVLASHPDITIEAIGMSAGGVIDSARGVVTHATDTIPGWKGADLAAAFAAEFSVPFRALNDAHAHGLGEALFGAGRDYHSMMMVAVGTGIGGSIVTNGSLLQGSHGAAGHLGHIGVSEAEGLECTCGRTGHIEALASGPGILRLAKKLNASDAVTKDGRCLARAAGEGDAAAQEAYRTAGFATGRVVGSLLNTIDVDLVTLAGGVTEAYSGWLDAVKQGVAHDAMDVVASTPIATATRGSQAALLGAAAFALSSPMSDIITEVKDVRP